MEEIEVMLKKNQHALGVAMCMVTLVTMTTLAQSLSEKSKKDFVEGCKRGGLQVRPDLPPTICTTPNALVLSEITGSGLFIAKCKHYGLNYRTGHRLHICAADETVVRSY